MIRRGKRLWAAALLMCVLAVGIVPARADSQDYRQKLLKTYSSDPGNSSEKIEFYLSQLEADSPTQGKMWRKIMSDWERLNHSGFSSTRTIKDGLAQDDSLCIVVFGYGLNQNGSMKQELIDRMQTALKAAKKYPNAYIAVTGGETSSVKGISEAAVMAIWLLNNDIPEERIILEKKSLSTTENAQNMYAMLNREYPQVRQLAVVTSDYHIATAATMMQTACTYGAAMHGGHEIRVVAGASCPTEKSGGDLSTQAWGISILTGTKWETTSSASAQTEPDATEAEEWSFFRDESEYWFE